jgi:type IV secretory pathway TrbL component
MKFFQAQKRIISLWFIWGLLLLIYVTFHVLFSLFKPIASEVITWVAKYLASIFALMTGSTFFGRDYFEEELKDIIYFRLAFWISVVYLLLVTVILVIVPKTSCGKACFLTALDNSGSILNIVAPILIAVLGYFFYQNKK